MQPRVSIIVPVYNVELYIKECLQSVGNQTIGDVLECLVVDDRGTDNSISVAEDFLSKYKGPVKFRIITRDKNGGLSAARNTGISEASGEYLYFLDSDDYIILDAMELLLGLADKHKGIDLISALYLTEDGRMNHFTKDAFPEFSNNKSEIKRALLDYDRIPVTAANRLIRRQLIIDNNLYFKEGIIHEDNYWTFFLAKYVKRMGFFPKKIYYYRCTQNSITTNIDINKEFHAYKTILVDGCNNIDPFEVKFQKRYLFLHLYIVRKNSYFCSSNDLNLLINIFNRVSTRFESFIIKYVCKYSVNSYIQNKLTSALLKYYTK